MEDVADPKVPQAQHAVYSAYAVGQAGVDNFPLFCCTYHTLKLLCVATNGDDNNDEGTMTMSMAALFYLPEMGMAKMEMTGGEGG